MGSSGSRRSEKRMGGVDIYPANRLKRDFSREIRIAADLEKRVAFAQRPIIRHVATGLAHEPHRRRVHGLAAAGLEEALVGH
jgi:hypothetical protein